MESERGKKAYINREVGRKRVLVLNPQTLREKVGIILNGMDDDEDLL